MTTTKSIQYMIDSLDISITKIDKYNIKINVTNTTNNNKYYRELDEYHTQAYNDHDTISIFFKNDAYDFIINCLEKKQYYDVNTKILRSYENHDGGIELIFSFKYEQFDFGYIVSLFPE
jgi:hypothetical protein